MELLFDLDGTLIDSREGIVRCIQHALDHLGRSIPPGLDLARYVGPPLPAAFGSLLDTTESTLVEQAVTAYRDRFERVGIFENSVFPGIAAALATFQSAGDTLHVVTAKPAAYARRILEHLGIAQHFHAVHGPELHDRHYTKESLIREALMRYDISRNAVMIGDRGEDILGARVNGLGSIAVAWGYGSPDELGVAGPQYVVNSPLELVDVIERQRREMSEARV